MEKINNDVFSYYLKEIKRIKNKLGLNFKYELVNEIEDMGYNKELNKITIDRHFILLCYNNKENNPLILERFVKFVLSRCLPLSQSGPACQR